MSHTAFLFPGQGSQEVGMARELFASDESFRDLIRLGSELSQCDLEELCLKGPDRTMRNARYLQPLLAAVELGYLRHLTDRGIRPDLVLGHSLGEVIALGASGVVSVEDAVRIAAKRGELMDIAASKCTGGMLAVMFVPVEKVAEMLGEFPPDKIVLANDNAPNQLVLSGDVETLDSFAARVHAERLGRCQKVAVAGPWHSPSMREARVAFAEWVREVAFMPPQVPMVLNATGRPESDPAAIKERITWQLERPVYWRQCMEYLLGAGYTNLFEIGPGRVLAGLARVNGYKRGSSVHTVNNLRGVEKAADEVQSAELNVRSAQPVPP